MADTRLSLTDGSLVDVLDRLVDTGAVIDGNLIITLAGVDLIRLDLHALLAATETLERPRVRHRGDTRRAIAPPPGATGGRSVSPRQPATTHATPSRRTDHRAAPTPTAEGPAIPWPTDAARDVRTDPRDRQPALAGLVVAVVDIVRQLLERQAVRRMAAGSLSGDEVERLGQSLMALEHQVAELTEVLGLRQRSPSTDLHPLGQTDPHRNGVESFP